jgi:hypothetical protein
MTARVVQRSNSRQTETGAFVTLDKFKRRNRIIAEHLAAIAHCPDSIGWIDSRRPLEPRLLSVLTAQEKLLNAIEDLLGCETGQSPGTFA